MPRGRTTITVEQVMQNMDSLRARLLADHEQESSARAQMTAFVAQLTAVDWTNFIGPEAPRCGGPIAEAVSLGVNREALEERLKPPVDIVEALAELRERALIAAVLPLLEELWDLSDNGDADAIVACGTALEARSQSLGKSPTQQVRPGRGIARVVAPTSTELFGHHDRPNGRRALRGVGRTPWITEHAVTVYTFVRQALPAQRSRGLKTRASTSVRYHTRALNLAVRLINAVYGPLLDQPLTVPKLKARIQSIPR